MLVDGKVRVAKGDIGVAFATAGLAFIGQFDSLKTLSASADLYPRSGS